MINIISDKLVLYLEKNNVLREEKDIYIHGARLIISSMIGTIILLIIGIITDYFIEAIIYEVIMSSSRSILGGYHCKSYLNCIVTYIGIYIICVLGMKVISYDLISVMLIGIIGLFITYLYCPIENINKLLSFQKKKIFKKYSLIYIIIYVLLMIYMIYLNWLYINFLMNTFIIINILTIGGKLDYEKYKE